MPNYGMPGVSMGRRGARVAGACAIVLAAVAGIGLRADMDSPDDTRLSITLRTENIGEGIIPGTKVRMDGVTIGTISEITAIEQGRQLITLDLDSAETAGLTDSFAVDYAPENLFGISALTLRRSAGGNPLRAGSLVDLAGAQANKVTDVTMGSLLRTLSETSTEVLTPKLVELIRRFDSDLRAFTPLLESVVMLSRAVAETQRYPVPFLVDQYSSFFGGLGSFVSSTFKLLAAVMDIEIFVSDRPRYDQTIDMIVNTLFPAIGKVGDAARGELRGYTEALTPLIATLAATVPTPGASAAEVTELIDRWNRMFTDTPAGPAVNVAVTLRGLPGLAVPLLGQQGYDTLGGGR
ncbi:MlaD family protein [Nocardia sp. NPDC052566]|uniref:MlaD family protein n=1 Tax=Nocardia sp. NPDC052566 TaxID=3364330 RepID=UPI0037CA0E82